MSAAVAYNDQEPEPGSFDDEPEAPRRSDLDGRPDRPPPAAVYARPVVPATTLARGTCRNCHAEGVALFARSTSVERVVCATCSGKENRAHVERVRETIRGLRAAAACGNSGEEYDWMARLTELVGSHQANETAKAIRDRLSESPGKGGRR